jgi:hypothetical protein
MVEDPLTSHPAHGPRRPIAVTPSVQFAAGAAVCGVIVLTEGAPKPSVTGGWQPIDVLLGKVKPAEPAPSIAESL